MCSMSCMLVCWSGLTPAVVSQSRLGFGGSAQGCAPLEVDAGTYSCNLLMSRPPMSACCHVRVRARPHTQPGASLWE